MLKLLLLLFLSEDGIECCSQQMSYEYMNSYLKLGT